MGNGTGASLGKGTCGLQLTATMQTCPLKHPSRWRLATRLLGSESLTASAHLSGPNASMMARGEACVGKEDLFSSLRTDID